MTELRFILLILGILLLIGIFLWGRRGRGQAAGADDTASARRMNPPVLDGGPSPSGPAARSEAAEHDTAVAGRWQDDECTSTLMDLPEIRVDSSPGLEVEEPLVHDFEETDVLAATDEHIGIASYVPERTAASVRQRDPSLGVQAASGNAPRPGQTIKPQPSMARKRKILTLRLSARPPERFIGYELRRAIEELGLEHGKYGIFHQNSTDGESIISIASMVEPGAFDLETMDDAQFAGITLFALLPGPLSGAETFDRLIVCAEELERLLGGELQDEHGQPLNVHSIASMKDEVLDFEHLLGQPGVVRE